MPSLLYGTRRKNPLVYKGLKSDFAYLRYYKPTKSQGNLVKCIQPCLLFCSPGMPHNFFS